MAANGSASSHPSAGGDTVPDDLNSALKDSALPQQMPDGTLVPTLTVSQIEELAVRFGTDGRIVEIAALNQEICPQRYIRNFKTFRYLDQIHLLKSHVTIIGLGGLGGTVLEWLTRAGAGRIRLVDGDRFEHHNLNRQLLCTQHRIGTSKATAAAERVCSLNSSLSVEAHEVFLNPENASQLIGDSDVVVDCLDSITSRFVLEAAAKKEGIPMVSAAVAGLSGQVTTIYPEDKGLELVYGPEKNLSSAKGAEQTLGSLPQAVGMVASAQCGEVIKVLLGQDERLLRNQLLVVDMNTNTYEVLELV